MSKGKGSTKRPSSWTASLKRAGLAGASSAYEDRQAAALFRGKTPTVRELRSAFGVPGATVSVSMTPTGGMRVEIMGPGVMGERIFRRTDAGLVAIHETFFLRGGQGGLQGQGIGSRLLAAQEKAYKRWGVNEIRVPRASEAGRYFWAKKGFVPNDMGAMRTQWASHLAKAGKPTTGAKTATIQQIVSHPEGKKFLLSTKPYAATKKL